MNHLKKANDERNKLGDDKITSEHVLLSILNGNEDNDRIVKVFKNVGLTYNNLFDKIKSNKKVMKDITNEEINKPDESRKNPPFQINFIEGNPSDLIKNMFGGIDPSIMPGQFGIFPNMPGSGMGKQRGKEKDANIRTFCSNLNELAEKGEIDPMIGRDREVKEIIRVLGRRRKNNVILVGGEGVGKTCIAESIAYKIVNGDVPPFMSSKKVISLDMTALIAGTTLRGMFEERVKGILDEIKEDGNYILMIDNIGAVLSDKGKNDYDISSMLSHALENGEVQVIGTSDFKSYRQTFDKDPSLSRRFQKVIVEAPSIEDSKEVLFGLKSYYETFHDVKYTDDAINACVELANRYITERNLPDSAIDVMDEAGSYVSTSYNDIPDIRNRRHEIRELTKEIENLKRDDKIDEAENAERALKQLTLEINTILEQLKKKRKNDTPIIDKDTILHIISVKTNIPTENLSADDKKKLSTMDTRIKKEVVGQDEAVDMIVRALKRNRIGLHSGKCLYSGILIGKSGIGKTLIAKKLAKEMFGNESALIRFDMSEYTDKSAVNKLIGSNPGYVGYDEGGQLTETIKNKKHCVLLLDEIEKADPEIYNIFLQVLDEGFLTDSAGMKVDFHNVIIIFTSNVGAKAASDFGRGIGFNEDENANTKRILIKQLKNKFPPEFLNRIDNIIYFNSLGKDDFRKIIMIEADKLIERMNALGYDMKYDEKVVDFILKIAEEQSEFGARPIKRAIQDEIEDKITDQLIESEHEPGYLFNVTVEEEKIKVS